MPYAKKRTFRKRRYPTRASQANTAKIKSIVKRTLASTREK